jgi:lipopolysaccharide transport system ATP-binding protein
MSHPVIIVENISKSYLVGHQHQRERYVALRDIIRSQTRNVARKSLDVVCGRQVVQCDEVEKFWALQDVSFEVKQGEVLGIIGRNGAGKSTLLKILSRITEPDRGRAILRGRVASLLEVGTGFHPELTGRENIFLNGAILGMKKAEIKSKFDTIVAFADVERFLDTPVKRYSSGMAVRLAFSIAAHLEPEILIIDEVLAVGDAEFQRKCLGKMGEVAQGGRTVLFVSHNMAAVKSLTKRGIVLDSGRVVCCGSSEQAIQDYMQLTSSVRTSHDWGKGKHTAIREAHLLDNNGRRTNHYIPGDSFHLETIFETDGTRGMSLDFFLNDASRGRIGMASTCHFHGQTLPTKKGSYRAIIHLDPLWLASGTYQFDVATAVVNQNWDHTVESAVEFDVTFSNPLGHPWDFKQSYGYGTIALLCRQATEFFSAEATRNEGTMLSLPNQPNTDHRRV